MSGPHQPLLPREAAYMFLSGELMAYASEPNAPFSLGRHGDEPRIISQLPFWPLTHKEAVAYFTRYPVILAGTYRPPAPGVAATALFLVKSAGLSVKGTKMAVALQAGQSVSLTVSYVDAANMPASKPGPITWSSSDATMVSVTVNPADDTQATATSVGEGATATISSVSGSITATIDVSVGAGPAVSGVITAGTPFPTPATAPTRG